jgi:mannosyltransferase OCH1-like enzyme
MHSTLIPDFPPFSHRDLKHRRHAGSPCSSLFSAFCQILPTKTCAPQKSFFPIIIIFIIFIICIIFIIFIINLIPLTAVLKMGFPTLRKFLRYWPLLAIPVILCLGYLHSYIKEELRFSALLDSSFITFDDFDLEYTKALNLSIESNSPIQYDYPHPSEPQIPRIIHHIWFSGISRDKSIQTVGTEVPQKWSGAQEMCRERNPAFDIRIWSAEAGYDFIQKNYAWFIPAYNAYKFPIQRVDALKYFLLWHYGGVYIDLDIGCRRPLDPLLEFSAWFPRASPLGVNNDLMASRPGHPVLGKMIESLQIYNYNFYFTYPTVFWSTGPMFVNTVVKNYWFRDGQLPGEARGEATKTDPAISKENRSEVADRPRRYSGPGDIAVLPQMFYSEEYSFFGHLPGGSWHGNDAFVVVWIWERRWSVLGVLFVLGAGVFAIQKVRLRRRNMQRMASTKLSFA